MKRLTQAELARRVGRFSGSVANDINKGRLKASRIGGKVMITATEAKRYEKSLKTRKRETRGRPRTRTAPMDFDIIIDHLEAAIEGLRTHRG